MTLGVALFFGLSRRRQLLGVSTNEHCSAFCWLQDGVLERTAKLGKIFLGVARIDFKNFLSAKITETIDSTVCDDVS